MATPSCCVPDSCCNITVFAHYNFYHTGDKCYLILVCFFGILVNLVTLSLLFQCSGLNYILRSNLKFPGIQLRFYLGGHRGVLFRPKSSLSSQPNTSFINSNPHSKVLIQKSPPSLCPKLPLLSTAPLIYRAQKTGGYSPHLLHLSPTITPL